MTDRTTWTPEETILMGTEFGATLKGGDVVALTGTLGSGKTCFVKGVCSALGVRAHVGSPTFTLINEYPGSSVNVAHIDLYRLSNGRELGELCLLEYFTADTICLIEWPELALAILPEDHYTVMFRQGLSAMERLISIDRTVG